MHAIGIEQGKAHGKKGWVVVAQVPRDSKATLPSSLTYATEQGEVEVPLVTQRSEPFKLE